MTILKNVEIHFAKLIPERPSSKLNPENPTWEIQIRTKDKEQRKEWVAHNIRVKPVREDPKDDESPILHYQANLKKKSLTKEGKKSPPVEVVKSVKGQKVHVDPATIGNGSIANIRIFEYDYVYEGVKGKTAMLMGIQLVKHVMYVQAPMEEFDDDVETETLDPADEGDELSTGGKSSADDNEY